VIQASNRQQIPAIYSQFFKTAYFDNSVQASPRPERLPLTPSPLPAQSKGEKGKPVGYSFMNIAFGLGSYLQGDIPGGVIVTSGYAAAIGLIAWELSMTGGESAATVPGNIGVAAGAVTIAFGFIKPFIFNYNHKLASASGDFDIALVSNERNKSALSLRYTRSF
jgi:hypothetical protein